MPEGKTLETPWVPPMTLEEKIVNTVIPAPVLWRYRAMKGWYGRERELRLLRYLVDPAKTSVDAGANKGVYTYFLAKLSRQVFAYEPNPKIFGILRRSVGGANVTLRRTALSDVSGQDVLIVPRRKGGYSNQLATLRKDKFPGEVMEVPVETRRLDDEDIGDVGFIKIDVEGLERKVLAGAARTIERHRPRLLVEIQEAHTGEPVTETLAFVCGLGYEALFLRDGRLCGLSRLYPPKGAVAQPGGSLVFNFIFLPT